MASGDTVTRIMVGRPAGHSPPQPPPGVYLLLGGDCPSSLPLPQHPLGAGPGHSWSRDRVTGLETSGPPAHSYPSPAAPVFLSLGILICQDRPCIADRGCVESAPTLCISLWPCSSLPLHKHSVGFNLGAGITKHRPQAWSPC